MAMRSALPFALLLSAVLLLATSPALADTFGGFSGVDKPYLINQDRVCQPLVVSGGVAKGTPQCDKVTADVVAHLSIKEPIVQRGPKATFAATVSGKTITISKDGQAVITWSAVDPISKIVEVYASQYEDRVAVAYTARLLGKDATFVVAFELVKTTGTSTSTSATTSTSPSNPNPSKNPSNPNPSNPTTATTTTATTTTATTATATATTATATTATATTTTATTAAPADDPKLTKAIAAAKKASKTKAIAAWQSVLAMAPDHSEAMFRLAAAQMAVKANGDAIATLDKLAKSTRSDAIEWLVEARFEKAFAAIRADQKYRAAVGLDRKPTNPYERLMGFGGHWEQTGTSCETPEVRLELQRDRSFRVHIKTVCQGMKSDLSWKGKWRLEGDGVVLALAPAPGQKASAKDEAPCTFEPQKDEDGLHCVLDRDLDFTVLPTRR